MKASRTLKVDGGVGPGNSSEVCGDTRIPGLEANFGVKVAYTVLQQAGGVRVIAELSGVAYPDTVMERPQILTKAAAGDTAWSDVDAVLASLWR
jgi:hypothetical protein